jgi:hypothetical protein
LLVVDRQNYGALLGHLTKISSGKQKRHVSPGSIERMSGCSCSVQCFRACLFFELSQHPTAPHPRQDLR